MAMPETPLHECYGSVPSEHQVRGSWQFAYVESVAVPGGPDGLANVALGSGASVSDAGHQSGAFFFGEEIAHNS